ncbi:heavy-metal-associated domain-containing protein [Patescibacteria group bacterium]|nr:heavy-metal-associated domain-containing protein [Patescibacteria group bacterium]MBU0964178.1 heavy-metal-associated domain-containing protein [Patescibacteria group bacterium]
MQSKIKIQGTHCPSCKTLIEDVCRDIPSVNKCAVDFVSGQTIIDHDPEINWQELKKEIEDSGEFQVEVNK